MSYDNQSSWSEQRRLDRQAEREQKREDAKLAFEQRQAAQDRQLQRAHQAEEQRRAHQEAVKQRRAQRRAAAIAAVRRVEGDTAAALVVMGCSIAPAAWSQVHALTSVPGLPAPIAVALATMVEGGTWAATIAAERAKRAGRPSWVQRSAMWGCASFAAVINYAHAPGGAGDGWLAWVLGAASLAGVAVWELRGWGRHGKAGRSKEQRRSDEKRRQHLKARAKRCPKVHARYLNILASNPLGTLSEEDAWTAAWRDTHGADVGQTAEVIQRRNRAAEAVAAANAASGHSTNRGDHTVAAVSGDPTPESVVVEALLAEIFGGDDDGDGGVAATSPGDPGGDPTPQGRLEEKGSGRVAPKVPERDLNEDDLGVARRLAATLGDPGKLSTKKLRDAGVCGAHDYVRAVRDAVRAELSESATTEDEVDE